MYALAAGAFKDRVGGKRSVAEAFRVRERVVLHESCYQEGLVVVVRAIPRPMSGAGRRRSHHRYRPGLLVLEDRRLLSTFVVNTTADGGSTGTLRRAVAQANSSTSPSTIDIEVGFTATLTLTQGPLVLTNTAEPTKIADYGGVGPNNMADVTISGNKASRVFQIDDGVTATVNLLLEFSGGSTNGNGGCIYNAGTLYLLHRQHQRQLRLRRRRRSTIRARRPSPRATLSAATPDTARRAACSTRAPCA